MKEHKSLMLIFPMTIPKIFSKILIYEHGHSHHYILHNLNVSEPRMFAGVLDTPLEERRIQCPCKYLK